MKNYSNPFGIIFSGLNIMTKKIQIILGLILFIPNASFSKQELVPLAVDGITIITPVHPSNSIWTDENVYSIYEDFIVNYTQTLKNNENWIGIFHKGDTKNSYNIVQDLATYENHKGELLFYGLDSGEYDIVLYGYELEPHYPLDTISINVSY